ncbi:MAG: ACT domain-containing protein [Geodermatophilaceae bacterium]
MEQAIIAGVAHDRSEAKVTVVGVPDKPGEAAAIFRAVADAEINIDMIVQNVSHAATGRTDISFTLPERRRARPRSRRCDKVQDRGRLRRRCCTTTTSARCRWSAPACEPPRCVRRRSSRRWPKPAVNIEIISTSEIRISVICRDTDAATPRCWPMHDAFELGRRGPRRRCTAVLADDGLTPRVGGRRRYRVRSAPPCRRSVGRAATFRSSRRALLRLGAVRGLDAALGWRRMSSSRMPSTADPAGLDIALFSAGAIDVARRWPRDSPPRVQWSSTTPRPGGWTPTCRWSSARSIRRRSADARKGIIANPNCTTMAAMPVLKPLHDEAGCCCGSWSARTRPSPAGGRAGVDELDKQAREVVGRGAGS